MKRFVASLIRNLVNRVPISFALWVRRTYQSGSNLSSVVAPMVRILEFGDFSLRSSFETLTQPFLKFDGNDSVVTRTVFWRGIAGYEHGETELWRELCLVSRHVVEIGANIGLFALTGAFANPNCRYQAFEPHPEVFQALRKNIELNGIGNVEPVEAAIVGDDHRDSFVELGIAPLTTDWHGLPSGSSIRPPRSDRESNAWTYLKVPCMQSTEVLAKADLIKIDAEGAEAAILRPVTRALADRQVVLLLEVLPGADDLLGLLRYFAGCGYEFTDVQSRQVISLEQLGFRTQSFSSLISRDILVRMPN